MMNRLQLIEEHQAEFADVLGVLLIVNHAAGKTASAEKHLAGLDAVAVRLLAGKGFVSNFLGDAFAYAHGRDQELADIEVAAEDHEDDGGNAHDIGAVAAHSVGLHALAKIALQDIGQALAQKRNIKGWETFPAGARSDAGERFGVSAQGHGN